MRTSSDRGRAAGNVPRKGANAPINLAAHAALRQRSRPSRQAVGATLFLALGAVAYSLVGGGSARVEPPPRVSLPALGEVSAGEWDALSRQRIFFGHQSVGNNLVDGLADVMAEHPEIRLGVSRVSAPAALDRNGIAHAMLGRNGDPPSKLQDFRRYLDEGVGQGADIAFFKFCYVDFSKDSNVDAIFGAYVKTMAELQQRYPATRFLHVTVPLNSEPRGAKEKLRNLAKRLLGKPEVLADNAQRQRFNELLKARFPAERIFDLALAEAVAPDGVLQVKDAWGAGRVMMLNAGFTDDGGHLNEAGRKRAAEQLLITLARATGSGDSR